MLLLINSYNLRLVYLLLLLRLLLLNLNSMVGGKQVRKNVAAWISTSGEFL